MRNAVLFILLSGVLFSCNTGNNENSHPESNFETGLPEGFEAFYKQFHRDSLFQVDHITFPLQGIQDFADSVSSSAPYYWEREDWKMHREINLEAEGFTKRIKSYGFMVEEEIRNSENFGTIRRFYLMDDEWKLIYYIGVNQLPAIINKENAID